MAVKTLMEDERANDTKVFYLSPKVVLGNFQVKSPIFRSERCERVFCFTINRQFKLERFDQTTATAFKDNGTHLGISIHLLPEIICMIKMEPDAYTAVDCKLGAETRRVERSGRTHRIVGAKYRHR